MLSPAEFKDYQRDGFVVIKGMLNAEEAGYFRDSARADLRKQLDSDSMMKKGDKAGNVTLLKMWTEAGDDVYGRVARDARMVSIARQIIDEDVYLYSHKMTMKEPRAGGAWEWHQDYGYWYQNKCLTPQMLSIWISLDQSVKENGCLQVLRGSHRIGRIDHIRVDGQTVVDEEYLAAALERYERLYVEMEPGDGLVFDCNLLHRSDANTSDNPRWGYIASYNATSNVPFRKVRDYGHFQEMKEVPAGSFMLAAA